MSTRSILAVVEGADFLGVKHTHDSYPSWLGNVLLSDLLDRQGDLESAAAAWIRNRPGGWDSFPNSPGSDEQIFYRRRDLKPLAWVDWFYLLDRSKRMLLIYQGNPAFQRENRWKRPDHVVNIGGRGESEPAVFSRPLPPWQGIPVDPGWAADTPRALEERSAFVQKVLHNEPEPGLLAREVEAVLASAIDGLTWGDADAATSGPEAALRERLKLPRSVEERAGDATLRVPFFWSEEDRYWMIRLGAHQVCFPSGAAFRQGFESYHLMRADGTRASLRLEDVLPPDLLIRLPETQHRQWVTLDWLRGFQVATGEPRVPQAFGRRFELSDDRSNKFWEIEQHGSQVTTRWGRIDTRGQSRTKDLGTPRAASDFVARTVHTKVSKGYREVGGASLEPRPEPSTRGPRVDPFGGAKAPDAPSWSVNEPDGTVHTVTNTGGGIWMCTCSAWTGQKRAPLDRMCRHIKRTRRDLERR